MSRHVKNIEILGNSIFKLQRKLSSCQAIPIIGIVPSLFKAVLSIVQVTGCLVCMTVVEPAHLIFKNDVTEAGKTLVRALTLTGLVSLGYSMANITTLGFAGLFVECVIGEANTVLP